MARSYTYSCTVQDSQTIRRPPHLSVRPEPNCSHHLQPTSSSHQRSQLTGPMTPTVMETVALGLIRKHLPQFPVQRLDIDISIQPKQMYWASGHDGNTILVTLPAPSWVKLLRCERGSLSSEGALLKWLSSLPQYDLPNITDCRTRDKPYQPTTPGWEHDHENETGNSSIIVLPPAANYILDYLPCLITHGLPRAEPKSPEYILSHPLLGKQMGSVMKGLDTKHVQCLQWQTGQLLRRTAFHEAPSGRFGPVEDVLRRKSLIVPSAIPLTPLEEHTSDLGSKTWSLAFLILAEAALRDLEDASVHIDYMGVRSGFHRFLPFLDRVQRPSLVALNGGKEDILVGDCRSTGHEGYEVVGLRDWGMCVFGDPLISAAFTENPSAEFLSGVNQPSFEGDPFTFVPVIEDHANAEIRLVMYECYHAMVQIAKAYHGPRQDDSVDLELPARARLQKALQRLEGFDESGRPLKGGNRV